MNVLEIAKKIGSAVIRDAVPGGGLIVDAINEFLPDDKKLPPAATGYQASASIYSLPPDKMAEVMTKQIDVQLKELDAEIAETNEWTKVEASLAQADASGNSTRPKIAEQMSALVVGVTILVAFATAWTCIDKGTMPTWELVTALLALPTVLLRAYFGLRSDEKKARYSVATGGAVPENPMAGMLKGFTGK